MHDTVEVVTFPPDERVERPARETLEPRVVGHVRVRVMRADRMEAQEQEDKRVGDAGENQRTTKHHEAHDEDHHEDALHEPVLAVPGTDRQHEPEQRKGGEQREQILSLRRRVATSAAVQSG